MLVVAECDARIEGLADAFDSRAAGVSDRRLRERRAGRAQIRATGVPAEFVDDAATCRTRPSTTSSTSAPTRATIEILNDKLAARGIMNIVLGGKKIGQAACPSASAASTTA